MSDPRPIGVFDSGVGGLTVAAALMDRLPNESIRYLGDTARLPYGTKSPTTVQRYTEKNVGFLIDREVKAVIVACNTASALALDGFHADVPVWGVIEPGADAAIAVTRGRVGVIATESTIAAGAYRTALSRRRPELDIHSQACGLFVPLVEEGWQDDEITETVARRYLAPLLDADIDTLVLGCTHYPVLIPVLSRIVGSDVRLVDSAASTAEAVAEGLRANQLEAPSDHRPEHHFFATDTAERFARIASTVCRRPITLEHVDV
ncbi:MAG: glutamate racemase [Acidobacteriota bacterium]